MSAFRRLSERTLQSGHVISMTVGSFVGPDEVTFEREYVRHPGAVAVVPYDTDTGEVVLVRQYRGAVDAFLLEIPAGKRDVLDEPPERTARRELAEEVGLAAQSLELLANFHNSPGCSDEHTWCYLATELKAVPTDVQGIEEEHMTVERVGLAQAMSLVTEGRITDAKTIIGLALASDVVRSRSLT